MASDPNDPTHPADDLIKAVQGVFNGDNAKQAIRDAWDRAHAQLDTPEVESAIGAVKGAAAKGTALTSQAIDAVRAKANALLGQ